MSKRNTPRQRAAPWLRGPQGKEPPKTAPAAGLETGAVLPFRTKRAKGTHFASEIGWHHEAFVRSRPNPRGRRARFFTLLPRARRSCPRYPVLKGVVFDVPAPKTSPCPPGIRPVSQAPPSPPGKDNCNAGPTAPREHTKTQLHHRKDF